MTTSRRQGVSAGCHAVLFFEQDEPAPMADTLPATREDETPNLVCMEYPGSPRQVSESCC